MPSWCPASSCIVKQPAPSTRVEASQPRECDLQGAAGRSSGGRALRTRLPLLGPELRAVGAAHTEATGRPDSGQLFSRMDTPRIVLSLLIPRVLEKLVRFLCGSRALPLPWEGLPRARVAPPRADGRGVRGGSVLARALPLAVASSPTAGVHARVSSHTRLFSYTSLLTRECFLGFTPGSGC